MGAASAAATMTARIARPDRCEPVVEKQGEGGGAGGALGFLRQGLGGSGGHFSLGSISVWQISAARLKRT